MPPVSKAQARFMGAVAGGRVKGVKPSVGREYLKGATTKNLPARVKKNGKANNGTKKGTS